MHELSVAQEIIRIVRDEQLRHGFQKVNLIRLKAGGFSCINHRSLSFAFQVVREGTCASKAELDLESEPIKMVCRRCGFTANVTDASSSCPRCRSIDIALEGDSHFEIVDIEVD